MKRIFATLAVGLIISAPLAAQDQGGATVDVVLGFGVLADRDPALTCVAGDRTTDATTLQPAICSTRQNLGARMNLRMSARTLAYTHLHQKTFDAFDARQTDQTTTGVSAGIEHDLAARASVVARVGLQKVETTRAGSATQYDGLECGVSAEQQRQTSKLFIRAGQTRTGQRPLSELRFGVAQTAKNSALQVSLGAAKLQGGSAGLVAGMTYHEDIRAAFHNQLRRDWGVVAGAQHGERRETGERTMASNSVFLTFEHTFSGGL